MLGTGVAQKDGEFFFCGPKHAPGVVVHNLLRMLRVTRLCGSMNLTQDAPLSDAFGNHGNWFNGTIFFKSVSKNQLRKCK